MPFILFLLAMLYYDRVQRGVSKQKAARLKQALKQVGHLDTYSSPFREKDVSLPTTQQEREDKRYLLKSLQEELAANVL